MRRPIFRNNKNPGVFCDDSRHAAQNVELGSLDIYLRYVDSLPGWQLIVKLDNLNLNCRFGTGQRVKRIMTGDGPDVKRLCRTLPTSRCAPSGNAVVQAIKPERTTQELIGHGSGLKAKHAAGLANAPCRRKSVKTKMRTDVEKDHARLEHALK